MGSEISKPLPAHHACSLVVQADLKGEPRADETGKLWTPGAVDFFRIVNEQLQVTQTVSNGNLLLRSGQASLRVMRQFQVQRLQSGSEQDG